MAKKKKKSLLTVLVGGVALGVFKTIFEEPKTVQQKMAQKRRKKRRGWLS